MLGDVQFSAITQTMTLVSLSLHTSNFVHHFLPASRYLVISTPDAASLFVFDTVDKIFDVQVDVFLVEAS